MTESTPLSVGRIRFGIAIKLCILLASFGVLASVFTGYYSYHTTRELLVKKASEELVQSTQVMGRRFSAATAEVAKDALLFADIPDTRDSIGTGQAVNIARHNMAEQLRSMLAQHPEYYQARVISAQNNGIELVRVDRDGNGFKIVNGLDLQEKLHFPYVYETLKIPAGQVYYSKIFINREVGAHAGHNKPTLQVATPVAGVDKKTLGVIVINVDLNQIFSQLKVDLRSEYQLYLANQAGDFLIHPDSTLTFGFDYGRRFLVQDTFKPVAAIVSHAMKTTAVRTGSADQANEVVGGFARIPFGSQSAHEFIIVGMTVPLNVVLAESGVLVRNSSRIVIGLSLLAIILSILVALIFVRPLKRLVVAVQKFSESHELTPISIHNKDELGLLAHSVSQMQKHILKHLSDLQEQNKLLEVVLDAIPSSVFWKDKDSRYLGCNRNFAQGAGMNSPNMMIGLLDDDMPWADRAKQYRTDDQIVMQSGQAQLHIEETLQLVDGSVINLSTSKVPLRDTKDNVFGVLGAFNDITERKKAEEVIRKNEETLLEAQSIAGLGSYDWNVLSGMWESSANLDKLLGIDDAYEHSFEGWAALIHPDDRAGMVTYVETEVLGQQRGFDKEYRIIRHDDQTVRWVHGLGRLEFDAEGRLINMRGTIQDISARKLAEAEILNYANYDQLTLLPNRRLFHDRLEQEIKKVQRDKLLTALLFIDLDRFKEVNDTLGHDIGDKLLITAAIRIKSCVREYDTVARLGGDEFTVILSELRDTTEIGRIAQDIVDILSQPFILDDRESYVSASIGIALYPDDAGNISDLVKHADQAMYQAKDDGRGCFRYFIKAMQDASDLRSGLATDLRHALAENQFEVHYQPIIDFATGRICKAEALIRWHHPQHGLISPMVFIPIAEDTGTIHEIGDWVFMQAALQVKKLISSLGRDFQISVNKSPAQFIGDDREHNHWIEKMEEIGLLGSSIVIEITEGLMMNNDAGINNKLLKFSEAGIQVAIDDFGTGYSSLAYLKKYDIDFLKIDRSFVGNLAPGSSELALCEAIVVMAHKLDIKVIAEGVETEQQRDLLMQMGCDYGQGYLFSRPVPAAEFEALME